VLDVELGEAVDLNDFDGFVERLPQIARQRIVGFLVEAELGDGAGLVPTRIVVIARGIVQTQLHVVMRANPLARVDRAALERSVDFSGWHEDDGAARLGDYLAAEAGNAHLEPFVVGDRNDLLPEPTGHLRSDCWPWAWHEIEAGVHLFPELEP